MSEATSRPTGHPAPLSPRSGDAATLDAAVGALYGEMRRMAARHLKRERPGQTLQPTALVHEVYLRLQGSRVPGEHDRAHFLGVVARSMRQILVERARARGAAKRGGQRVRVTLASDMVTSPVRTLDLEALDAALTRLALVNEECARLVELRFFGGLSIDEAADLLHLSPATIKRRWLFARAWLGRELGASS